MKTNYQHFLDGEYCNRFDPEVLEMKVQTKRLLARFMLRTSQTGKNVPTSCIRCWAVSANIPAST